MTNKLATGAYLLRHLAGLALLCAGWMAALPVSVFAEPHTTQWFVNGAGNDEIGCGTAGNPCETISYLLPSVASGDQISVTNAIIDNFTLAMNVSIAGAPGASIDGNGARIVTVNAGVNAVLTGLTLRNGGGTLDGGLIHNAGTLAIHNATLTQSVLNGASGGAIFNAGTLTITGSTISNNTAQFGGGIENRGALYVTASALSNNVAVIDGGGIDNFSDGVAHLSGVIVNNNVSAGGAGINNYSDVFVAKMWITDTAIISNTAQSWGAGIYNMGQLSIANATVSGNHLPSGNGVAIGHETGSLLMEYVTIAGNTVANASGSSAVNFSGSATIKQSVIASGGVSNCSGSATSAGYNFSSDGSCSFFNQLTDVNNVDARLGRLQYSTFTHGTFTNPPLSGSLIVNRIPTGSCGTANDQRGVARPQDGACDIGAHEAIPVDLGLTAQATPAWLPAGTTLTVTLNFTNAGLALASGVAVTSALPAGVTLKDCTGATSCVASGSRLTVTLGALNAGANAIATVRLTPQQSGNLALGFNIAGNEWDRQMANNTAQIQVEVTKSADISVRLSGTASVPAQATLTMTAEVENKSDFAADSPTFTLTLPANVSFIAAQGADWLCSQSAGVVSCAGQAALLPKQVSKVVIILQSSAAPATLQLIGSAGSNTFDPDITNNTTIVTLTIGTGSRVALPVVLR